MEPGFGRGGETRDRAGVLRNLGANQNDVKFGLAHDGDEVAALLADEDFSGCRWPLTFR